MKKILLGTILLTGFCFSDTVKKEHLQYLYHAGDKVCINVNSNSDIYKITQAILNNHNIKVDYDGMLGVNISNLPFDGWDKDMSIRYFEHQGNCESYALLTKNYKSENSSSANNDMSEYEQLELVRKYSFNISKIKNPTIKVQLEAVTNEPYSIEGIKHPSEKVQLVAVKKDGGALNYIKNPSEKVQLAAVNQKGRSIQYIKNPSEKVQLAALKNSLQSYQYIQNLTKEVKDYFQKVQKSEKLQLGYVDKFGWEIQFIDNPNEKVQLAAVTQKYGNTALQYIKNPSEKVQLAALKTHFSKYTFGYIKNPTPKVIEYYNSHKKD